MLRSVGCAPAPEDPHHSELGDQQLRRDTPERSVLALQLHLYSEDFVSRAANLAHQRCPSAVELLVEV
jgi:hypothetical protein